MPTLPIAWSLLLLRKKYGQDIDLPAYEDILSQEVAEEYSDVKSKADFN